MPGASMNEIKGRIKSIGNTMQITRAMELVATSKLRRARKDAEAADEFCRVYGRTVVPVIAADECFTKESAKGDPLYIVIAGEGRVDFEKLFVQLKEAGYEGDIVIEHEMYSRPDRDGDILRSKEYLEKLIAKVYN